VRIIQNLNANMLINNLAISIFSDHLFSEQFIKNLKYVYWTKLLKWNICRPSFHSVMIYGSETWLYNVWREQEHDGVVDVWHLVDRWTKYSWLQSYRLGLLHLNWNEDFIVGFQTVIIYSTKCDLFQYRDIINLILIHTQANHDKAEKLRKLMKQIKSAHGYI